MPKKENKSGNMYTDSIYQWNVIVGCHFQCSYCEASFQRQMKRQKPGIDKNGKKRGCQKCYDYEPHFHSKRLEQRLPLTHGDEFIWACSSSDIYFAEREWVEQVLDKIRELSNRTFFMQSKNPICFNLYDLPENLIIGTTIETNLNTLYEGISKAPLPSWRYKDFLEVEHPRKSITIEPIMYFNWDLYHWIKKINPERVYIGYDTKNTGLPEPRVYQVKMFIQDLEKFAPEIKVKLKYMKEKTKDTGEPKIRSDGSNQRLIGEFAGDSPLIASSQKKKDEVS